MQREGLRQAGEEGKTIEGLRSEVRRKAQPVREVDANVAGARAGLEETLMPASHLHPRSHPHATSEHEAVDPVCGMGILPSEAAGHVQHRGETYHFCSERCVERFQRNPIAFLTP